MGALELGRTGQATAWLKTVLLVVVLVPVGMVPGELVQTEGTTTWLRIVLLSG